MARAWQEATTDLPAEVAILAGTMRHDEDGREPLQGHEILNAAGRAGRAGHLANGTVLLIPEPPVAFAANGIPTGAAFDMLAKVLPANAAVVLNSGAASPGLSAACAATGSKAAHVSAAAIRCFMVVPRTDR